jgi:ribose transport system permease protein
LWLIFILVFAIWQPGLFLSQSTLHTIASSQAISAIVALAVLIPLSAEIFDLSVGANANFACIFVTILQVNYHWSMGPAMLLTVLVSLGFGVINGFIIVKLRVNSFIATLGTTSIITAGQVIISPQQPGIVLTKSWNEMTQFFVGGFQIVVLYLLILALIVWWVLAFTPAGRYLYAVGGNAEAARLSGIGVDKVRWLSLVASGGICGVAGVLYASLSGPALSFGPSLLLPAFASAYLGSTQLKPGRFNVWGTLIAIYVLATGVYGLELITAQQWIGGVFNGVALIGAVSFAIWRQSKVSLRSKTTPTEAAIEINDESPSNKFRLGEESRES